MRGRDEEEALACADLSLSLYFCCARAPCPRALGCVLYEMMTYKHAFDASSINGLAQKILKGQITQLPATYPYVLLLLLLLPELGVVHTPRDALCVSHRHSSACHSLVLFFSCAQ